MWFVSFLIIHFLLQQGLSFNPLCYLMDCCSSHIILDPRNLKLDLENMLHGQHLVWKAVTNHITSHLKDTTPKKALVLSFHGETGTGKNYASEILVKNLFYNGMKSDFVYLYHAAIDFPHESMAETYINRLKSDIEKAVYLCPRSIFIFDEFHLMPPKVIDIIQVYLDFHAEVNKVDYRKSIFIFLSNLASADIRTYTMSQYMKGIDRTDIELKDFQFNIARTSFAEKGGFLGSDLIKSHLVTAYVPFLPLQRKHVKKCIEDEMNRRKKIFNENFIDKMLTGQLNYWKSFK